IEPELRHAGFGLEFLGIGQPFSNPVFAQLPGDRRKIGPDFTDAFVTRNLVATETAVYADQIAARVDRRGLRNFVRSVVTFVAARFDLLHGQHRSFQKFFFGPVILVSPFFALLLVAWTVASRIEINRAIKTGMTRGAAEAFERMRRAC